jgi:hypothetical protein
MSRLPFIEYDHVSIAQQSQGISIFANILILEAELTSARMTKKLKPPAPTAEQAFIGCRNTTAPAARAFLLFARAFSGKIKESLQYYSLYFLI